MKQFLILSLLISLFNHKIYAQETVCKVAMEQIKGKYTGDCVKDKANGKGKSVGTDQYEGDFKDGYPDGKGIYIWKDGHYFVGSYKKGNKEGEGKMYYEAANGEDSVITGFWKKDKYIGRYEKEFVVLSTSGRINKIDCRLVDKKGADILITVHLKLSAGYMNAPNPLAYVNNVTPVIGNLYTYNHQLLNNSTVSRVQQVTFPFRAIYTLNNGESFEIQFNEKGNWDVYVDAQ